MKRAQLTLVYTPIDPDDTTLEVPAFMVEGDVQTLHDIRFAFMDYCKAERLHSIIGDTEHPNAGPKAEIKAESTDDPAGTSRRGQPRSDSSAHPDNH